MGRARTWGYTSGTDGFCSWLSMTLKTDDLLELLLSSPPSSSPCDFAPPWTSSLLSFGSRSRKYTDVFDMFRTRWSATSTGFDGLSRSVFVSASAPHTVIGDFVVSDRLPWLGLVAALLAWENIWEATRVLGIVLEMCSRKDEFMLNPGKPRTMHCSGSSALARFSISAHCH